MITEDAQFEVCTIIIVLPNQFYFFLITNIPLQTKLDFSVEQKLFLSFYVCNPQRESVNRTWPVFLLY